MLDPKRITKLRHDWSLVDDGEYQSIDAHRYRLLPPKWVVAFEVSNNGQAEREVEWEIRRAGDMLVDEILKNPHVKEAVDARVAHARQEGYFGAMEEMVSGKRFDLGRIAGD